MPIFWNKKADEKETVISAAQQVLQQLQELGIEVGLDDTNADTPGQKYRYWYTHLQSFMLQGLLP